MGLSTPTKKELAGSKAFKMNLEKSEWDCPLHYEKPCNPKCYCFVEARAVNVKNSDSGHTWTVYEKYCDNAMFSMERNTNYQ